MEITNPSLVCLPKGDKNAAADGHIETRRVIEYPVYFLIADVYDNLINHLFSPGYIAAISSRITCASSDFVISFQRDNRPVGLYKGGDVCVGVGSPRLPWSHRSRLSYRRFWRPAFCGRFLRNSSVSAANHNKPAPFPNLAHRRGDIGVFSSSKESEGAFYLGGGVSFTL